VAKSKVSIAKTPQDPNYEQVRTAVEKAVDLLGGMRQVVKPGQKVLINPSWVNTLTKRLSHSLR
jgi:uncharacterized protein (DUF362 family)